MPASKTVPHPPLSNPLLDDQQAIERIFQHIDNQTTDLGDSVWREPVEVLLTRDLMLKLHYCAALPCFCPSAALPETGSYIARKAAGTPLVVVRGRDGRCALL